MGKNRRKNNKSQRKIKNRINNQHKYRKETHRQLTPTPQKKTNHNEK